MKSDVARRLESLSGASGSEILALGDEIERRLSSGEFQWVGLFAEAVALRAASGTDEGLHYQVVLDRVRRTLAAHPGPQSLRILSAVEASRGVAAQERVRAERGLARLVADGHRVADIAEVVFAAGAASTLSREFKACLLHELVFRSVPVEEYPALRAFAGTLVSEGHPLAVLPLRLLPSERGLRRPRGAADDWTWAVPPASVAAFDEPELLASPDALRRTSGIDMTEITDAPSAAAMGAAVRPWCSESNGVVAAQEFWSPDAVSPDDFTAVLRRLPLTAWPEGQPPVRVAPATPDTVLRTLLTAAVLRSAYGSGLGRAYGRLAAWQSLGGLTGAPADAPPARVTELVEQTHWFRIAPVSDWFNEVAWDLAVAALRPGGQEIAVLTATDTD
ncbi:DUF6183 family protein [Streptomyces sp. NPDC059255]|uniref:DUF6183 family protein n=1 Tax=Streptomyces sp. NPDC059255 TaxID=3346793 RepID=UPI003680246C